MSVNEKYSYIQRLREPIELLHKCRAYHVGTEIVKEPLGNPTTHRLRTVEIFELSGHDKATVCYAWSDDAGNEYSRPAFHCFLQSGSVNSPESALVAASLRWISGTRAW